MHAVQDVDLCSFFINNGAGVNAHDYYNNTALHCAILKRRTVTVRLLRYKANYCLKTCTGVDALQIAVLAGCNDIIETILEMSQLTVSDAIMAYELFGTQFVVLQNDMVAAVQIWRKAIALWYLNKRAGIKTTFREIVCLPESEGSRENGEIEKSY